MPSGRGALTLVTALLLVTAAACGGNGGDEPSAGGPSPGGSIPATAPAATPTPAATPSPTKLAEPAWSTSPVRVVHNPAVPPVPVMLRIRAAQHPQDGYDRVVFDFDGPLPGYEVRYVDKVVQDGSGNPMRVPGRRFLLATFTPAQAHTDAGAVTVSPRARTLNFPMLEAYAISGDFEGVVSVALGLDDVVGFRVGELSGRIYIDVAA